MTTLTATTRKPKVGLGKLRVEGKIPATIYGGIATPLSVSLDAKLFKKAWHEAGGSLPITVETEGGNLDCIIQDFSTDPVTDKVLHVDLLALDKNKKVEVDVELEFIGISPAVKSGLGVLEKMLHEVEVSALPKDLPKSITVDLSVLTEVGSQIAVKDLPVPTGVEVHEGADEIVAIITEVKEEKEEESGPIDMSKIELSEEKGKKEEAGEEPSSEEKTTE